MGEHVIICEVGPRDGLQIAKGIMPTATKQRWITAMAAAGVAEIEVGSFVSPKLIPQMADTGEIVRHAVTVPGLTVVALAPNLRGAMAAYEAGAHRISIPVSVSEGHSRANLNRSPEEQIAEVGRIIEWLGAQPRKVPVEASCSTAFGCSFDGRVPVAQVVKVAAGLGGCPFAPGASGNIVTEDLVFMLESMGFSTGIDLGQLLLARAPLREGLPNEPMRGGVPQAGIPKTFAPAA